MPKSNWLIYIAILCCHFCLGQAPAPESSSVEPGTNPDKTIFTDFAAGPASGHMVRIQWRANYLPEGDYFIVERSADQVHFETVSAIRIVDTLAGYDLTNAVAGSGIYFYRIKWIDRSGNYSFSQTIPVRISADFEFKFYPNPADKLLIVRSAHAIELEVVDGGGGVRLSKELASGLQIINIANLEKGNYILRVADKESNRVFSTQLLKN